MQVEVKSELDFGCGEKVAAEVSKRGCFMDSRLNFSP